MEWKAEYGLILFGAFLGGLARYVNKKDDPRPVAKALISQLVSVVIAGAIAIGTFYNYFNAGVILVFLVAIPLGMATEKGVVTFLQFVDESKDFMDFLDRMMKAYRAAKGASPETPDQTKLNHE